MYRLTKAAEGRISKELNEHEPEIPVENVMAYVEELANKDLERKGSVSVQAGVVNIKVDCMDFVKDNFV